MESQAQNFINQLPPSTWSAVSSWPFISCCVCIAVLILTFKRAFSQLWPKRYATSQAHGIFTLSYLFLGLLAAIPKSYLPGTSYFQRAILGIIASGASLTLYHAFIKRISGIIGVKDNYLIDPDDAPEIVKIEERAINKAIETNNIDAVK
jgi:hypothetical protein